MDKRPDPELRMVDFSDDETLCDEDEEELGSASALGLAAEGSPAAKRARIASPPVAAYPQSLVNTTLQLVCLLYDPDALALAEQLLLKWIPDVTTAGLLCRLPILHELHTCTQSPHAPSAQAAIHILSSVACSHKSLARTLLLTLGPNDFLQLLGNVPRDSLMTLLFDCLTESMLGEAIFKPSTPNRAILTAFLSRLEVDILRHAHASTAIVRQLVHLLVTHMQKRGLTLTDLLPMLNTRDREHIKLTSYFLCALANEPSVQPHSVASFAHKLVASFAQLERTALLACLQCLDRVVLAQRPPRSAHVLDRADWHRLIFILESERLGCAYDDVFALTARIICEAADADIVEPSVLFDGINLDMFTSSLESRLRYYFSAQVPSKVVEYMLALVQLLIKSAGSGPANLIDALPLELLCEIILAPAGLASSTHARIVSCIHDCVIFKPDVVPRLCTESDCLVWFSRFVDDRSSPAERELLADVLRLHSEHARELKSILGKTAHIEALHALIWKPPANWQRHVIWMLRYASSGSERRKEQVFRLGAQTIPALAQRLGQDLSPGIQKELAAFFKSLTSMAGARKDSIFGWLDLPAVSSLLSSPFESVQEHVAGLLRNLTHGDTHRKEAVFSAIDLDILMSLLFSPSVRVLQSVTGLLQNLCTRSEDRRTTVFAHLPLEQVVTLLRHPDVRVHAPAAGLLMNLCRQSHHRKQKILTRMPLSTLTSFYDHGPPDPALADQANGLLQHLRMAFLASSREALQQYLHDVVHNDNDA
ncbi:uncharacterized protein MONBRDRAFT_5915 [Monosiga brevicollis MX1]|uniref:Uncharacterized protein n=1 Tax=Monosiga brevicollis TaxID=81824 RepID=A9USV1_MONBE|nr:uncharacterized protein MONBRDRAFT_5915 [Monosiga brevicollis MX1]EDQ92169.1 predicted protein [Monosiga brevicollis MX1]|eukprot:XP_001743455.1 hypothetical protein [Monosiga brevicollis MX1]